MKPFVRWIGFQLLLLLAGTGVLELALRGFGYVPGDIAPNWMNFKPVDSLVVYSDFVCNQEGLLVADTSTMRKQKIRVNSHGFRTPEFSNSDSSRKKLLLIGDSFTWGLSANPIDSCFADVLRRETEWNIINLGIPVTDPPQYDLLAKKYIPELKPDLVVVCFFMDNDLMLFDRPILPNRPVYFLTNAGALLANIDGKHFGSAEEAYNYSVNEKYHLKNPESVLEKIIAQSALLSRLYAIRFRLQEKIKYEQTVRQPGITLKYLKSIAGKCRKENVPLWIIVIPSLKEADLSKDKYRSKYTALFDHPDLKAHWIIPGFSEDMFTPYPDAHLNNKGHRAYAEAIKGLMP